ncbi:DUF2971 domain-containing protein [bacterium]|nr:DUF2971 domain-containing protein [bacterium]
MSYYKYVTPARIDVLERLKIRYTQVSALNDPFEALPAIDHVVPNRGVKKLIKRHALIASRQKRRASRRKAKEVRREIVHRLMVEFDELYGETAAERFQDKIRKVTEATTGILSLSKVCDNILMWSHYADSHRGMAIEFDSEHAYFDYGTQDVNYSDQRPRMELKSGRHSAEILTTKSSDWSYEQEVRRTENLTDNVRRMPGGGSFVAAPLNLKDDPDAIHLFDLPDNVIVGVILGWKSSKGLLESVREVIQSNSKLQGIQLRRAVPSRFEYRMEIEPICS